MAADAGEDLRREVARLYRALEQLGRQRTPQHAILEQQIRALAAQHWARLGIVISDRPAPTHQPAR